MKKIILLLALCATVLPSNPLFAQKNRISLQTGVFHSFMDGTPIFNKEKVTDYHRLKYPLYVFNGQFNDSWGFQYRRSINAQSHVSCEYMIYNATYQQVFPNPPRDPSLIGKRLQKVNVMYARNLKIRDKWQFNYGAGVSTQWGVENWFLHDINQPLSCIWQPNSQLYYRNDLDINLRSGVEYSPISQLTLFSYIDFQGTLFLSYPSDGNEDAFPDYFAKYRNAVSASRIDLSLNFGIGFNF